MGAQVGNGLNGALHREETFYSNGYHSPSFSRKQAEAEKLAARQKYVEEVLSENLLYEVPDSFRDYMYSIQSTQSPDCIIQTVNRIVSIYKQLYSTTDNLNTSTVRPPKFIDEESQQEIAKAFEKAEKILKKYRDTCIEEAIPQLPRFLIERLKLESQDIEMVRNVYETVLPIIREQNYLVPEFMTFLADSTRSYIHYVLGIPKGVPNSETAWLERNLKQFKMID